MARSLTDLENFYDGSIPLAEWEALRAQRSPRPALSAAEQAALELKISGQIEEACRNRLDRQHAEDLARVAAADAGLRGTYHCGTWLACIPARVAEARARIAFYKKG